MASILQTILKGLNIRQEGTHTPKEVDIIPGGTAGTKTTVTTSQTANRTITTPDITDTLVTRTNTETLTNKTLTSPVVNTPDINGGTIDAATIATSTIDSTPIGALTPDTGAFTSLLANTADINGGTIDNTAIGSTVPSTGAFTTLTATSATIGGGTVVTDTSTQTLSNKSLDDTTTRIVDTADPTKKIGFDVTGATATTTTIRSSQTVNRTLDLPDATDTLVGRNTTDTLTNKTLTAPTISGGTINNTPIGNVTPAAGTFAALSSTSINTTAGATIGTDLVVQGDLTVNGTTVTLNTQTLDVEDANITVNKNGNDASAEGAGLTVDRTGADGSFIYKNASATKFALGSIGAEVDVVGTTSTQSLTNKSLVDTTTAIVDSVDATKQIKFDAGGTTATSTTLTAAQTANRVVTVPDATTTLVGTDTTDTLTNKTLQFTREAVATNNTTTGTAATLAAFTTGVVRLTNTSLVSLSGIPAGVSGQYLTLENLTTATISIVNEDVGVTAANRIYTGSNANITVQNTGSIRLMYDTTDARWMLIGGSGSGSGSGSGGVNFITTGDAETTNPFIGYQYFSTTRPVASAGSPAVTGVAASISATAPLAGNSSFLINKTSGANAQGLAVDIPFIVSPAYRARATTIEFDYLLVSGTFQTGSPTQDSDLIPYIIDVDSNTVIEPSNFKFLSNSTTVSSKFSAQFQTSSTSVNYRLTFYTATTNTTNYSMKIDNIKVGPSQYVYGSPVTDSIAYTPTFGAGFGTPTNVSFRYHRDGERIYVRGSFTSGTHAAAVASISLPTGLSIDTTKTSLNNTTANPGSLVGDWAANGNNSYYANIITAPATSATSVYLGPPGNGLPNVPMTSFSTNIGVSNIVIDVDFSLPIAGWSSSVQTSDGADTRVVAAKYRLAANTAFTAANVIVFTQVLHDTHNALSGGRFTAPVPGIYRVSTSSIVIATANIEVDLYKNGVNTEILLSTASTANFNSGSTSISLVAGDIIDLRLNGTQTLGSGATFVIERLSGPSTIAASEINGAGIQQTAQSFTNGVITTIICTTILSNTHGSYNVSTGTFTCNRSGFLDVTGSITYPGTGSATTGNVMSIYRNGGAIFTVITSVPASGNNASGSITALMIPVVAGDQINVRATLNGLTASAITGHLGFVYR